MNHAVIFDVDGVLLDLTGDEEGVFFAAFNGHCDPDALSRDWNTYQTRNDDDIVDEIMARHGIPRAQKAIIVSSYFAHLKRHLDLDGTGASPIAGAAKLILELEGRVRLGIATANFHEAARLRLAKAGLWERVSTQAFGADGGGAKREILARAIANLGLPPQNIVFVGDNVNDVEAGLGNGVHFIGFSTSKTRLETLRKAGASFLSDSHETTLQMISQLMPIATGEPHGR